jgi:hypothetical protein
VIRSIFVGNTAEAGGAIFFKSNKIKHMLLVANTVITLNKALHGGGVVYHHNNPLKFPEWNFI